MFDRATRMNRRPTFAAMPTFLGNADGVDVWRCGGVYCTVATDNIPRKTAVGNVDSASHAFHIKQALDHE